LLHLQLITSTGLDNTLLLVANGLISDAVGDTLGALPAKGLEALRQMGVREVVAGVHPIGVHGAKVLDLELEKRTSKLLGITKLLSEGIGLELELAADDMHKQVDDEIHRSKSVREEDETNDDRVLLEETERGVQRVVVDENREEEEDVESMGLRDTEQAGRVTKLPVAQFVSKNSNNLIRLALLDESIVDNNVLLPGEAKEIGVGVGASLASINDIELVERELEASGKSFNLGLELTILKRRQLVEQRQDSNGVDGDHEDLKSNDEEPQVVEELVTSLLDDLEETCEERRRENEGESLGLDEIGDEELRRLLVETKLLLKDESLINRRRKTKKLANNGESQDEYDSMADLSSEARRSPLEKKITSPGPQFRKDIEVHESEILNLRVETVDDFKLCLGATVGLRLVEHFLGDFLGEDGGRTGFLEDAVLTESEK